MAYNTGAVTLPQAVDQATNDFLSRGLNCIEYRNVRRVNIDAYAEMAVRTLVTRPYLQDESAKFERYREILGDMAPDSLDKFMKSHQKMRYFNYN